MAASHGSGLRDIIIVGGSVGGIRAATSLRRRGFEGRIKVLSAETTPHYYRPALSKTYLSGAQDENDLLLPVSDDLDLDIAFGATATALDPVARRVTVTQGSEATVLGYDGLVIATGLAPKRLPLPPLEGIHYVRELAQARSLRDDLDAGARVVVIGGGLIGSEVAATCRTLGREVTIVEAADTLMQPVLGTQVGRVLTDVHRAHGVDVRTSAAVGSVTGATRVESVTLTTGERLPADVVVVAVGSRPRTDWLEGSGLHLDDGVLCAPNLRVLRADSVVAVGDVARIEDPSGHGAIRGSVRIEHWENAMRHADVAAGTLLTGPASPPYTAHTMFWTKQYDLQVHLVGHPDHTDELRSAEGAVQDLQGIATYHRGERITGVLSLNQPQGLRAYRPLLEAPKAAVPDPVTS